MFKITASAVLLAMAQASKESFNAIAKVNTLLTNMKEEQEKEMQTDEKLFKKMDCWCNSNRDSKSQAVESAKDTIAQQTARAEKEAAAASAAQAKKKEHEENRAQRQKDLDFASKDHEEKTAQFNDMKTELDESLASLNEALKVLATGEQRENFHSLIQIANKQVESSPASSYSRKLQANLLEMFAAFPDPKAQLRGDQLGLTATSPSGIDLETLNGPGYSSGNRQSDQIVGMLQQMEEGMQTELATVETEEVARVKAYQEFVTNLNVQIKILSKSIVEETKRAADSKLAAAEAKNTVEEVTGSLGQNQQFLLTLDEDCKANSDQYQANLKARGEEIEALSKALAILQEDSVRELFDNQQNSFLQMSSHRHVVNPRRAKAAEVLRKQGGIGLLALASSVKLDSFTRVKAAIDEMVEGLKQQLEDDVKHRDFCIEQTHQNKLGTQETNENMNQLTALIEAKEAENLQSQAQIKAAEAEVQSNYESTQEAGEDRAEQSKAYQASQSNGKKIDFVLNKVLNKLKEVYAKESSFVQMKTVTALSAADDKQTEARPQMLKESKQSSGAGGVLTLIAEIIGDNQAELKTGVQTDNFQQESYNKLVGSAFADVEQLNELINSEHQALALANAVIGENKNEHSNAFLQLEALDKEKQDLFAACSFVMSDNYDIRREGMKNEIDACNSAKAVLSGAIFD